MITREIKSSLFLHFPDWTGLRQIIKPNRMAGCSSLLSQVKCFCHRLTESKISTSSQQLRAQQYFLGWQWWLKSWNNSWLCWKWPFPFSREVIKAPLPRGVCSSTEALINLCVNCWGFFQPELSTRKNCGDFVQQGLSQNHFVFTEDTENIQRCKSLCGLCFLP